MRQDVWVQGVKAQARIRLLHVPALIRRTFMPRSATEVDRMMLTRCCKLNGEWLLRGKENFVITIKSSNTTEVRLQRPQQWSNS